jgi:hypothetical protein
MGDTEKLLRGVITVDQSGPFILENLIAANTRGEGGDSPPVNYMHQQCGLGDSVDAD